MLALRVLLLFSLGLLCTETEQASLRTSDNYTHVLVNQNRRRLGRLREEDMLRGPQLQLNAGEVSTHYFEQYVDHFNPTDDRLWEQRYFARSDLYEEGGPVFIYIGGESAESPRSLADGVLFMTYLAEIYKAKLYDLEHRYYGESHPTADLKSGNMEYLSADQALADLAYFIDYLVEKGDMTRGQKVVVFGGSYPGNLAAWARIKYPHLVHAAVSSSAPVHAEADFDEYYLVVSKSIKKVAGQWCFDNIKMASDYIVKLLRTSDGYEKVRSTFRLSSELKEKLDLDVFFEALADPFAGAVQYNRDNVPQYNIKHVCSYLGSDNVTLTPDQALQGLAKLVLDSQSVPDGQKVDLSYKSQVESYRVTTYLSNMRQWTYQTCTEFGYFQTFSGYGTPFPSDYNDLEYAIQLCKDVYGSQYDSDVVDRAVRRSNLVFGDRLPDVNNVIFVNGNVDPWHALGVLSDINDEAPAVVIEGGSHCADMNYPRPQSDSKYITMAHEKVHDFVRRALYAAPSS